MKMLKSPSWQDHRRKEEDKGDKEADRRCLKFQHDKTIEEKGEENGKTSSGISGEPRHVY